MLNLLEIIGFALWDEGLESRDVHGELQVIEGLREFQEHLGGILHVTLLRELGRGFEVNQMDIGRVKQAIDMLRTRAADKKADTERPLDLVMK